jgi:ABC-2 type transport system ATP-binding protein
MSHGEIIAENETDKLESEQAGQNKLKIVIKGDKQEIFKVVRESGLLKSFEYVRDIEPEVYEFSAIAAEDKDVRDELFVLFAEHKMVVYSLNIKQLSLEDVFIKLTGKEINDESSI